MRLPLLGRRFCTRILRAASADAAAALADGLDSAIAAELSPEGTTTFDAPDDSTGGAVRKLMQTTPPLVANPSIVGSSIKALFIPSACSSVVGHTPPAADAAGVLRGGPPCPTIPGSGHGRRGWRGCSARGHVWRRRHVFARTPFPCRRKPPSSTQPLPPASTPPTATAVAAVINPNLATSSKCAAVQAPLLTRAQIQAKVRANGC